MSSIAVARRPDLTAYRDTDALSALIATIYDAAIDPAIWPDVLRAATTYLGGQSSAIYAKNISGTQFEIFQVDGQLEEKYAVQYFETYSRLDPATAGHLYAELEQPISTEDILDPIGARIGVFSRVRASDTRPAGVIIGRHPCPDPCVPERSHSAKAACRSGAHARSAAPNAV